MCFDVYANIDGKKNLKMVTDFVLIQRTKLIPPTFLETTLCDKIYAKIVDHIVLNWLKYSFSSANILILRSVTSQNA